MTQSATLPPVVIDAESLTVRPATPSGDAFYGLELGTNGTAATCRRELQAPSSSGLTWVRYSGKPALGVLLVPTANSDQSYSNPWLGE